MATHMTALYLSILSGLVLQTLSAPSAPPSLLPRNESSVDDSSLVTKIVDGNGTDISSGFRTMIFEETPLDAISNFTDRQVPWVREISSCRHQDASFEYSFCKQPRVNGGDLQAYTIVCSLPSRNHNRPARTIIEHGQCVYNELCLDGREGQNALLVGGPLVPIKARCVGKAGFLLPSDFLTYRQKDGFPMGSQDASTQLIFSSLDERTPLMAKEIDVSMVVQGGEASQTPDDKTCTDCYGLTVNEEGKELSMLKTQATIQGATTGVLWIALMSSVLG